jgi:hypothetical protein
VPSEPEHLVKLNFDLEALDRDVRKPHENPAIDVLPCALEDPEDCQDQKMVYLRYSQFIVYKP